MATITVEQVFRTEWSRLVATLVRELRDLDLAEDCAQEAFAEAARRWPTEGAPRRPGAWLLTTARRKAIDRIRRAGTHDDKLALLDAAARSGSPEPRREELVDDQLALLLGCCHPALDIDAQIALTLRSVVGLTTTEIAHAFLVAEATMSKRLTRAKHKIRAAGIPFAAPSRDLLRERLGAVLHVVYLVFTQGHTGSHGGELVRGDLCDEAIWLTDLLCELVPGDPEVLGLASLVRLTDARRSARLDAQGGLVLLEDQDRRRWDRDKIATGFDLLRAAHETEHPIGPYVLQAAAAAVHAAAPSFAETDWPAIVEIYDRLAIDAGTIVVLLNRAIALSYTQGPAEALRELEALAATERLDGYLYLHSARGELLRRLGRDDEALESYRAAQGLAVNDAERRFLEARISTLAG